LDVDALSVDAFFADKARLLGLVDGGLVGAWAMGRAAALRAKAA
jgi:hypothetical protein